MLLSQKCVSEFVLVLDNFFLSIPFAPFRSLSFYYNKTCLKYKSTENLQLLCYHLLVYYIYIQNSLIMTFSSLIDDNIYETTYTLALANIQEDERREVILFHICIKRKIFFKSAKAYCDDNFGDDQVLYESTSAMWDNTRDAAIWLFF